MRNSATAHALDVAHSYLGGNPTGRRSLWCADFVNLVERKIGRPGTGSRKAHSFLGYGQKVGNPQPGDIVVLSRGRRSGHVGYFKGWEGDRLVLLSGNYGNKVGVGTYSKSRVVAFIRP